MLKVAYWPLQLLFVALFGLSPAYAGIALDQLTANDVDKINRDFSALFSHTTVSGASGLLDKKVYEVGIIAGLGRVPNINKKSNELDPGSAPGRLPAAGVAILYSYSKRTTLEIKYIPDLTLGDIYLGSQSLGAKFTLPEADDKNLNSAFRIYLSNNYLRSKQTINNSSTAGMSVDAKTEFASISLGGTFIESYRLVFGTVVFEPFVGLGAIQSFGDFRVKAPTGVTIFESRKNHEKSSQLGYNFMAGFNLHYLFTKVGFEYGRIYDSDRVMVKIAFGY